MYWSIYHEWTNVDNSGSEEVSAFLAPSLSSTQNMISGRYCLHMESWHALMEASAIMGITGDTVWLVMHSYTIRRGIKKLLLMINTLSAIWVSENLCHSLCSVSSHVCVHKFQPLYSKSSQCIYSSQTSLLAVFAHTACTKTFTSFITSLQHTGHAASRVKSDLLPTSITLDTLPGLSCISIKIGEAV